MTASIFDDMLAKSSDQEATDTTEPTDAPAEATETNASEWPKTVTLPAGERPEGSVTVAEFADLVNKVLVKERVEQLLADGVKPADAIMDAIAAQVSQASFYQAVKAQRNPLPHYVVKHETQVVDADGNATGAVETSEKTYIPSDVALDFWKNRPTRGAGAGRSSEEDIEKRLYRAGKKAFNLAKAEERLTKLESNVKAMREQLAGYVERLAADGKSLDDAKAAFEAAEETDEEANAIDDDSDNE